jgi:hypothetical protein
MVRVAAVILSSDGLVTSLCLLLLGVTIVTDNLMSDYQLLLDRFMFRYPQIQVDIHRYMFIKI